MEINQNSFTEHLTTETDASNEQNTETIRYIGSPNGIIAVRVDGKIITPCFIAAATFVRGAKSTNIAPESYAKSSEVINHWDIEM